MVIISTRPVAEIIQAVSAGSILSAASCAHAGAAAQVNGNAAAMPRAMRPYAVSWSMVSPLAA